METGLHSLPLTCIILYTMHLFPYIMKKISSFTATNRNSFHRHTQRHDRNLHFTLSLLFFPGSFFFSVHSVYDRRACFMVGLMRCWCGRLAGNVSLWLSLYDGERLVCQVVKSTAEHLLYIGPPQYLPVVLNRIGCGVGYMSIHWPSLLEVLPGVP